MFIRMELNSPRLRLRLWRPEDRTPFAGINDEPTVRRYLSPLTRAGLDAMMDRIGAHFARHGWGLWALEERASGALIGLCGLEHVHWQAFFTPAVEISWRLSTPWQGKGFAREAAETTLTFGFDTLALDRVVAVTTPANTASWGLMIRLGMRKLDEFDHPSLPEGSPLRRQVAYEITARDWRDARMNADGQR
jgi:RimJ/RimL family protein N-acetyltransferase